jgi:hypothetical protein
MFPEMQVFFTSDDVRAENPLGICRFYHIIIVFSDKGRYFSGKPVIFRYFCYVSPEHPT